MTRNRGTFAMQDLTGQRFGRLIAQWPAGRTGDRKATIVHWLCCCDCGRLSVVRAGSLRTGSTRSCRCGGSRPPSQRTHGHCPRACASGEYKSWSAMLGRCYRARNHSYKHYGGRGITVCPRWRDSFESFLADMGTRPDGTTLDRINNDGNYEPSNCRWATATVQQNNRGNNVRRRPA